MGDIIRDNLAHIDRLGLCHRHEDVCAVCKKPFYRTVEHVYKHSRLGKDLYSCSWTCYRIMDKRVKRERKERPKKERPKKAAPVKSAISKRDQRIEQCKAKLKHYTEATNAAQPGTQGRKNAQNRAREWRIKLQIAKMKGE